MLQQSCTEPLQWPHSHGCFMSVTPVFQLPSCLKLLLSFPSSLLAFSRFFVKSFLKTNQ